MEITAANTSNRVILLNGGEDCELRFLEPIGYSPVPLHASLDAQVTVVGGRNVVAMGAQFAINSHPETALTAQAAPDAMTLTVASTAGFPESGVLRIAGEGVRYSSKTATTFAIAERNFGYFNGAGAPPLAFPSGEKVYIGEQWRGALSLRSQTGFVHIEGALIEGTSLIDGIRIRGSAATTVTLQNSRVGPVGPSDAVNMQDGHADCIQTWGSGVKRLRMSHMTLLSGVNGRAFINAADTSGGGAVEGITMFDTEMIDLFGRRQTLVTNSDSATAWTIANAWLRSTKVRSQTAPELAAHFNVDTPWGDDFVPASGVGIGYVSPTQAT